MFALFIWLGSLALITWAVIGTSSFMALMKLGGWLAILMCFAKFYFLGTLGELLTVKRRTKSWQVSCPGYRAFFWGLFGIWIGLAFVLIDKGVMGLIAANLWPAGGKLWLAFSKSLWINVLSGYAFSMMVTHGYTNFMVAGLDDSLLICDVRSFANGYNWGKSVPYLVGTIFIFWLPVHTITFSLPAEWRTLMAALLSIALGVLLSIKEGRHSRA